MVKTLTLLAYLFGNTHGHQGPMQVTSVALRKGHPIPAQYTCKGRNASVPLRWRHLPPGTKSLVVILTALTHKESHYLRCVDS